MLPNVTRIGVWGCVVAYVVFRYVEGISRIKKCSMAGRGVLTGDISMVFSQINAAVRLKYVPAGCKQLLLLCCVFVFR